MGDWSKDRKIHVGRTLIDVHFIVRHGDPTKLKRPDEALRQTGGRRTAVGKMWAGLPSDFPISGHPRPTRVS